jgi:hypothetical protein
VLYGELVERLSDNVVDEIHERRRTLKEAGDRP